MDDDVALPDDVALVPDRPADATDAPTPVTLAELARVSAATPAADPQRERVERWLKNRPTTPAGLPKGASWIPHDTGRLGHAAARRRAQQERRAVKLAARAAREG